LRVDMCELHKLMQARDTSFQDYHDESVRMRAGQTCIVVQDRMTWG